MGEHALLGASNAKIWLNCTKSARLGENIPDTTSQYAAAGSLAHEFCELKVRKAFIEPMGTRAFNSRLKKLQEKPLYNEEMLRHTDTYTNYISGIVHGYSAPPYIAVEKKLDYSAYVPGGFGTADCIIIGGKTMYVVDFKYGKGVSVSATDNPQMMLYSLGAILEYSILYSVEQVVMVVVQPRLDSISEFVMSADDILFWASNEVAARAELAWKGEGECVTGEHCRFCHAKNLCRTRTEFNTSLEVFNYKKPPLLTNEEVGQILEKAQDLAKWAKDIAAYALGEAIKGADIPGWKAVAGRGSRSFADTDEAFNFLATKGYNEALLYKREPLSTPQIEELLGKPTYTELLYNTGRIVTAPGKPTLVPSSDKRESFQQHDLNEIFKK